MSRTLLSRIRPNPIGPFYSEQEAKALEREKDYIMKEDAGRGWRRVVASPEPLEIVEIDTIKTLWDTTITVTCGGGGIPVVRSADGSLRGVAAVIDKDLAAERLAEGMGADILMILTEVEQVCLNFNGQTRKRWGRLPWRKRSDMCRKVTLRRVVCCPRCRQLSVLRHLSRGAKPLLLRCIKRRMLWLAAPAR